jgi:hypothetical protein
VERAQENSPDLERLAATELAILLNDLEVGSHVSIDSSSEICYILELLIPKILRREHREWGEESLDGFFFSCAIKTGQDSCELAGTCVLIRDQTVTPFALNMSVANAGVFGSFRIKLGEPGKGLLGISGPKVSTRAAQELLLNLNERLDWIDWAYEAAL